MVRKMKNNHPYNTLYHDSIYQVIIASVIKRYTSLLKIDSFNNEFTEKILIKI